MSFLKGRWGECARCQRARQRWGEAERTFEPLIAENFPNLIKDMNINIQGAQ